MKNGALKIDKGIPVPAHGNERAGLISSTLRKLGVGDSVLLPCGRTLANSHAWRVLGSGNYTCRPDGKGFRIWRTK